MPQDTVGLSKCFLKRHGTLGVWKQEQELAKNVVGKQQHLTCKVQVGDLPIIRCG